MRLFKRLSRKRICQALGLLLLVCVILASWFYYSFPGLSRAVANHLYHCTREENWNQIQYYDYWIRVIQQLQPDTSTGLQSFDQSAEAATGDAFELARIEFHRGDFDAAIALTELAVEREGVSEQKLFWLAMSYLRKAENDNCLNALRQRRGVGVEFPPVCTLPIDCCHDSPESARRAAAVLERLLDEFDATDPLYRWLLNFSHMTTGGFPDQVPPRYRIDSHFVETFHGTTRQMIEQRHADLVFRERARELHVDTFDTGRGVAVEDFDRDGYLDIVTGGMFGVVRYYQNVHGQDFVERTEPAGLGGLLQPHTITAADFDNDGWIDLLVARPFHHFCLLHNRGDGTFVDVTESSGMLTTKKTDEVAATWVSAWADIDNDGDLDLMLAQCGTSFPWVKGFLARVGMDSTLFLNQDGRFLDVTKKFGLAKTVHDQLFIGASFGDYDADGYPDLILSSPWCNTSVLMHNDAGQGFLRTGHLAGRAGGFTVAFVDVNHDGRLDIFQGGFGDARTSTLTTVFGQRAGELGWGQSTILLQTDDGRFIDRSDFFSGKMPVSTMGASYGDLNNDGAYDFYLGTGNPEAWFVLPNLMYLGKTDGVTCTGAMENISMINGFGTIQKGHGIVFFDFDEDGDQDVYSSLGGMWPGDAWPNQLFVNESQIGHTWIKLRLHGTHTNRFGVGARIRVVARNRAGQQLVRHYHMDQKTGFGSGPYLAHIGLLDATRLESVQVYWPVSRHVEQYACHLNQLNVLFETAGEVVGSSPKFD